MKIDFTELQTALQNNLINFDEDMFGGENLRDIFVNDPIICLEMNVEINEQSIERIKNIIKMIIVMINENLDSTKINIQNTTNTDKQICFMIEVKD